MGGWAELFRRIAVPRLPGSVALAEVEAVLVEQLIAMGYTVSRVRFSVSDRSLVAVSVGGAGLGWIALLMFPFLSLDIAGWPVTLTGFAAIALTGLIVGGIHRGDFPVGRREVAAENITAVRGGEPRLWLVAHSDSKSQGLSLAGRTVAVAALSVGTIWLAAALSTRLFTALPWWLVLPGTAAAVLGGGALSRGAAANQSPGAVDNATGIVAALYAAQQLVARSDVGVLITGAEEYGMVGARVWSAVGRRDSVFINFDGIDCRGSHRIVLHRHRRQRERGRCTGRALRSALGRRLAAQGHRVIPGWLPFGVLVDGVALARGGMSGVTLSRGDLHTARRVHTARDSVEHVSVAGALQVGQAAVAAVEEVLG